MPRDPKLRITLALTDREADMLLAALRSARDAAHRSAASLDDWFPQHRLCDYVLHRAARARQARGEAMTRALHPDVPTDDLCEPRNPVPVPVVSSRAVGRASHRFRIGLPTVHQ